jgi:hypothetical protein
MLPPCLYCNKGELGALVGPWVFAIATAANGDYNQSMAELRGGARYRHPQAWIDLIVETDPALANVTLSYPPRYASRLKAYGRAILEEPGLPGYTSIGRASLVSRRELVDTIIHEEVHHRLWRRASDGSRRAWRKITDLDIEEDYVEEVVGRFLRLQDHLKSTRKK